MRARIERRFDAMVDSGLVAEVREPSRARRSNARRCRALRAVGYRQIWGYLDGAYDWQEARRRAIVATRQLAKRQLTWLRGDRVSERWAAEAPGLAAMFLERVERFFGARSLKVGRLC